MPCGRAEQRDELAWVSVATAVADRDDARAVGPVPRLVEAGVPRAQQPVARAAAERLGEQVVEERRQDELRGDAEQSLPQPDLRPSVGRHPAPPLRLGRRRTRPWPPARGTAGPWRGMRSAAARRRPAGPARPASGVPRAPGTGRGAPPARRGRGPTRVDERGARAAAVAVARGAARPEPGWSPAAAPPSAARARGPAPRRRSGRGGRGRSASRGRR